jgi:hypothetical protein
VAAWAADESRSFRWVSNEDACVAPSGNPGDCFPTLNLLFSLKVGESLTLVLVLVRRKHGILRHHANYDQSETYVRCSMLVRKSKRRIEQSQDKRLF